MTIYLENVVYELEPPYRRDLEVGPGEYIPGRIEQRGCVWTPRQDSVNLGDEIYLPQGKGTWIGPFIVTTARGLARRGFKFHFVNRGELRTVFRGAERVEPERYMRGTWDVARHVPQTAINQILYDGRPKPPDPKPQPTFDDYRKRIFELHPSLDRSSGDVNKTPGVHPQ